MSNPNPSDDSQLLHFKRVEFSSRFPGTRVLITGAVHGNEICGTQAIHRVIREIECGLLQLQSGHVSFIPVTNPLAYYQQTRSGERNLNRRLRPCFPPTEFEDHVANWLCPIMAQHQVLLDLHSFRGEGQAFVMVGPKNNQGEIEPFKFAAQEEALAKNLGVHRFVDGWLSTYAKGVARRREQLLALGENQNHLSADKEFGVGTTEYMRSIGGYALTLECGQHQDPMAPEVAYRAILNTLRHFGVLQGEVEHASNNMEALHIYDVIDKAHPNDKFARNWASFDQLKQGDIIAYRHDGTPMVAENDGRIIFPDEHAQVYEEWFYLAKNSQRI